jgi:hypothetical protein
MNVNHAPRRRGIGRSALVLAALLPILFASLASAQERRLGDAAASIEHDFVGARKCKSCHGKELMGDQNSTWQRGPHAHAFETLASPQSQAIARERGLSAAPSDSAECLVCHVTAFGVPEQRIWKPLKRAEGVQCESCHGPGRDFRKKKIMADIDKAREKGLWDPGSDHGICLRCHNDASPTVDPLRYTLSDGSTRAFDYEQAADRIAHPIPEHVKGHYIELRKKQKEEEERQKAR